jgi:hypothetical protein
MQDAFGIDEKPLSGFGQHHAPAVAVQEPQPELAFECAHLAADGRLRQADDARGASGFSDVNEELDLPQIHVLQVRAPL